MIDDVIASMPAPKDQIRKRGKKISKKATEEQQAVQEPVAAPQQEDQAAPNWLLDSQQASTPYGDLNPDLKSYLRDMDQRLTNGSTADDDEYAMMMEATLTEMASNELCLSTDPECALMVEHMIKRMGDFEKRVFADALMGEINTIISNRFGSHVLETFFESSKGTIMRESSGNIAKPPSNESEEPAGELRTITKLIVEMVDEIVPKIGDHILNPHATYPVRYLLHLLSGDVSDSVMKRSKKSQYWLSRHDNFDAVNEQQPEEYYRPPKHFKELSNKLRKALFDSFSSPAEIRAFGVSDYGAPILQLLLHYEKKNKENDNADSFLDSWMDGLIGQVNSEDISQIKASSHVTTTLLDTTASHTTETAMECSSSAVFEVIWQLYFTGKGGVRCMKHPVGNFVYAKALKRMGNDNGLSGTFIEKEFAGAITALRENGSKLIKTNRSGPLMANCDVGVFRDVFKADVMAAIMHCFGLSTRSTAQAQHVIPCMLEMKRWKSYRRFHKDMFEKNDQDEEGSSDEEKEQSNKEGKSDRFTSAGAQLILSLYNLGTPHNEAILNSLLNLSMERILEICGSSPASRIIDGIMDSEAVTFKYKHKLRLKLLGSYHLLADMRVGSRVAEKIYETSDGYFREKIANSLLEHEDFLAGSAYGKYLIRKVGLSLFRRRIEEWREKTAEEVKNAGLTKVNNVKKAARVINGVVVDRPLSGEQHEDRRGPAVAKKRKSREDNEEKEEIVDKADKNDKPELDNRSRQEKREEKRQKKYKN
ncbi:Nucleolar protein 9 [Wallemia ichthyophaga EXF-994]|uniref:Nucleolar protein 9 n=1 Tax=Wallemia ichthyophaga (strain EXF-994 / CBS 113033) TaxID=1299270 RepID=R9AEC9_WALI9|nr:Nucleolar protein 9 [Wallemia ichthyophaga EXF-994]EOR00559.1 Nucleolar protein 9 [Wallemia ichthyophaga EXF-994]